jgi:hypothetical protein
MAEITGITLGREREQQVHEYGGPADGAVSALIETGLRAAQSGDQALARAQVFALPPEARAEYRQLLAEIIQMGRKPGVRLDPFGGATLHRIERDAA